MNIYYFTLYHGIITYRPTRNHHHHRQHHPHSHFVVVALSFIDSLSFILIFSRSFHPLHILSLSKLYIPSHHHLFPFHIQFLTLSRKRKCSQLIPFI
jgi:hypothetical protein